MKELSITETNRMISNAIRKIQLKREQEAAIQRMASFWPEPHVGKWEDMGWSNDDVYRKVMTEYMRRSLSKGW